MEYYDSEPAPGMPRRHQTTHHQKSRQRGGLGCSCDCNYSKSRQGICKIVQIFIVGLAWILIAASPYYREIFVIGGVTWPFHIVMLISILVWFATIFMLVMFLVGYHHQYPNVAWPTIELAVNLSLLLVILIAAYIEAANCWRWDMQSQRYSGTAGAGGSNALGAYGLTSGMSFTNTINFSGYCARQPRDCQDYVNLIMGNNSYFTNHLFATVLLFFAVIAYIVSSYFAYKTWKEFNDTMSRPGDEIKPSLWMKWQYRFQNTRDSAKNKVTKVFKGGNGHDDDLTSDEEAHDIEMANEKAVSEVFLPPAKDPPAYSVTSDHKSTRSSHHNSHHPKSDRSSRSGRRYDERSTKSDGRSSRSDGRSSKSNGCALDDKSSKSGHRSRGSSRPHSRSSNRNERSEKRNHDVIKKKPEKIEEADDRSSGVLSPTASVVV